MSATRAEDRRILVWILAVVVLTPILTGADLALNDPLFGLRPDVGVAIWVELEMVVLVAAALLTARSRNRSEMRRIQALRRIRDQAIRDPLTGLYNRRGLVSLVTDDAPYDGVGEDPVWSLVLLDLDGFKQVNDRHGHSVGDSVLVAAASALDGLTEHGWLWARLGGDEFVAARLGPAVSRQEAAKMAELVPSALTRAGLPTVSASVGMSHARSGIAVSVDEMVRDADAALADKRGVPRRFESPSPVLEPTTAEREEARVLSRGQRLIDRSEPELDESAVRHIRRAGLVAAISATVIGLAAIAGVLFDAVWLRGVSADDALSLSSASALALGGAVLAGYLAGEGPLGSNRAVRLGGSVIALMGAAVITEHLVGFRIVPTTLVHDPIVNEVPHATRSDLESGALMLTGGSYMAFLDVGGSRIQWMRTAIALMMMAVVGAASVGLVLGAGYAWTDGGSTISPQGLAAAVLLLMALLAVQPRQPAFWAATMGGNAARTTRRLLIAGFLTPLACGALIVYSGIDRGSGLWSVAVMLVALVQAGVLAVLVRTAIDAVEKSDRETALLSRELREIADRDPLTGLANRGRFDRELADLYALSQSGGSMYAIALIDLNLLKRINTDWGYEAGDAALLEVADALKSVLRPGDVVARLGGDEFALLLPDATRGVAEDVARRCAESVSLLGGEFETLTLSWGAADNDGGSMRPAELVELADQRLYTAKSQSRQSHT